MVVIWLTGPSGAGKSTLARALEERLRSMGKRV
ncbi:MAG: adenylyl-sulfate kinase, partial [Candidatus Diapherotrites archaeon]|nr:adenylyl-sulfate kinase [Candidatus Diapherotrites archaeon]